MIEKITEKLKDCPIKVVGAVVFGSFIKDTFTEDSDIDLLIIAKDIHTIKHKRGKEIAKIKEYLSLNVPIDGWRFPVKYRELTYLSNISNKDFAFAMIKDGERDFKIGETLIKENYFDKAVYHFQQSTEKAIKAVLICSGEFKKTHFVGEVLIDLLKKCAIEEKWVKKLNEIASISLEVEPEVTWSRYPGINQGQLWIPYEEYTEKDAIEVKEKAEKILKGATDFVAW